MAAPVRRRASIEAALVAALVSFFATAANLYAQIPMLPSAVAYDAVGNLYFADRNRNEVLELSAAGALTVFAGTGTQGFAGDGGPASAALLNAPEGIDVGADGTVYIADTGNQRIRLVANGVVATVAGTGVRGFSGDGSAATTAQFNRPTCVAVARASLSPVALLICDTGNERVRSVSTTGAISTFAGTGVQGFAGDGGPASAAEFNAPRGLAVDSLGRVLVADTLNQRVRSIGTNGIITTIAGNGVAAFTGDNGAAVSASLSLPTAVAVDPAGDVLITDTGNQRIRLVNSGGTISTVAGTGIQGMTNDGAVATSASLNQPLALALNAAGNVVFSDSQNARVRLIANGQIYTLVPVQSSMSTQTSLVLAAQSVYGTSAASVTVTSAALQPTGSVNLLAAGTVVATAQLQGGQANFPLSLLPVRTYQLQAVYSGDPLHESSSSASQPLTVTPAALTASATAASATYGQAVPALSGTVVGMLAQDAATTSVQFATSATALSPVGTYPILATLHGAASGNYTLTTSPTSGVYTIGPAASSVLLQSPTVVSYAGLPVLLTASVSTSTSVAVSGQVQFYDGSTIIATAGLLGGAASTTYTPSASGSHSLTASFVGNANILPSNSAALVVATAPMPDFTLATTSPSQTVQGGLPATYTVSVASLGGTFTGIVSLAISGLPKGATAVFAPSLLVPGASGGASTLTVQTVPLNAQSRPFVTTVVLWSSGFALVFLARRRRRSLLRGAACFAFALSLSIAVSGCGARTVESEVGPSQLSQLTVAATSTNLAGSVVTHTLTLNLTVE